MSDEKVPFGMEKESILIDYDNHGQGLYGERLVYQNGFFGKARKVWDFTVRKCPDSPFLLRYLGEYGLYVDTYECFGDQIIPRGYEYNLGVTGKSRHFLEVAVYIFNKIGERVLAKTVDEQDIPF